MRAWASHPLAQERSPRPPCLGQAPSGHRSGGSGAVQPGARAHGGTSSLCAGAVAMGPPLPALDLAEGAWWGDTAIIGL